MDECAELQVEFVGPFAWPDLPDAPSVFRSPEGHTRGLYLWIVPTSQGNLVYYVGETGRSFRDRFLEHYKEHAAGFYHIHSLEGLVRGEKVEIWPGRYDPENRKSIVDCVANYARIAPFAAGLISVYRFLLAPLEVDGRVRRRIEAALAREVAALPGRAGQFQEKGMRYQPRRPSEAPVTCHVRSCVEVIGFPLTMIV